MKEKPEKEPSEYVHSFELLRMTIGNVEVLEPSQLGPVGKFSAPIRKSLDEALENEEELNREIGIITKGLAGQFPRTIAILDSLYLSRYAEKMRITRDILYSHDKEVPGALLHDFLTGFSVVLCSVREAYRALQVGEYGDDNLEGAGIIKHFAHLLREDETGFLVVDSQVEQITLSESFRDGTWIKFYNNPEFVVGGAEMAQDYYKRFYPKIDSCFNAGVYRSSPK